MLWSITFTGHTTWTAVNDFEARAEKKLRLLKKASNTHGSLDSEDMDEDWRNILQCEEDQVRLFYSHFSLIVMHICIILQHCRQNSKRRVRSHQQNVGASGKFVSPKKRVIRKLKSPP